LALLTEYILIASIFSVAVILTLTRTDGVFLPVWFMPWLLFGEAFHFFIELPEHLGREQERQEHLRQHPLVYLWRSAQLRHQRQ
jgi:hypothetical protein